MGLNSQATEGYTHHVYPLRNLTHKWMLRYQLSGLRSLIVYPWMLLHEIECTWSWHSNLACDYMLWSSNEFPYHWMQCGMLDKRCRHIISSSSTLYYTNTTLNASMLLFTAIIHNKQACTLLSRKTISLACTHDVTLYCCCSARVAQGHSPVDQCYFIRLCSDLQKALRWQYFVIIQ